MLANGVEDTPYTALAADLLSGFSDANGDVLAVTNLSASLGSVTDNGNGSFTITPPANYNGPVSLSYDVVDGNGGSVPAVQGFTLNPVNDATTGAPAATLAAGAEDTPYTVLAADLLAGFSDIDGDTLSVSNLRKPRQRHQQRQRQFRDHAGGQLQRHRLAELQRGRRQRRQPGRQPELAPTAVNDAPSLTLALADQGASEGSAFAYTIPAGAFTDVDGDALSYSATLASGAALPAWLSFDAGARSFSGTPPNGSAGTIVVRVSASDGSLTAFDDFQITVGDVNVPPTGAPTAVLAAGAEDTSYLVSAASLLPGWA